MAVLNGHQTVEMDWVDEQPARGRTHRIRCSYSDGQSRNSSIMAYVGGNVSFRFANPADNILIMRSEQAIDVSIIDETGADHPKLLSGLQLLNITVYIIRITTVSLILLKSW
jgi:hypothetical protein